MLRILFKLGLAGIGLLVILFLVGLTFSGDWQAKATLTIGTTPDLIYDDVANLSKWRDWSVWNDAADPRCKHVYEGPASGVGAKWLWDGPVHGQGSMTITEASVEKGIAYRMQFVGMEPATGAVEFVDKGDATEVTLLTKGTIPGVFGGWLAKMVPGLMESEFAKCLDGLKTRSEGRNGGAVDASFKKK